MTTLEATPTTQVAHVTPPTARRIGGPRDHRDEDPARGTGTADPGVIATTRRLAWALTGVPDPLPPAALDAALRERARAAREAGRISAAAAFEAAERYVARALEPEAARTGDGPAQMSRQQLFAAAVRQVHRAQGLSAGPRTGASRAPGEPPDPALIEQPAALIEDLRALRRWSGLDPAAVADAARRAGVPASERRLLATLEGHTFPASSAVEAIARGCGLSEQQTFGWLAARHRAARMFLSAPPAGARPGAAGRRAAAALDPQDAETPAQLTALLLELKARRGLSLGQIQHAASRAGHTVSWSRLWSVAARCTFPTARTLEAFVFGCGLEEAQREAWLVARDRLAVSGRPRTRRPQRRAVASPSPQPAVNLSRPGGPPDPGAARTWAQFAAALEALVRWSGRDLFTITRRSLERGIPVTTDALHYTLAHRTLPSASTLNAFTVGCGLSAREQFAWRAVRTRLAALPGETQRVPPRAVRPAATRPGSAARRPSVPVQRPPLAS